MKTDNSTPKRKRRGGRPRTPFSKQFENIIIPDSMLRQFEEWEKTLGEPVETATAPQKTTETIFPWCCVPGGPPRDHPEANRAVRMTSYPTYNEFEVLDYYINDNNPN